jgi:hypothetical protein
MSWPGRSDAEALPGGYPRGDNWEAALDEIEALGEPPIVAIRRAAAQSINTATFTNISWDTEDLDLYGMFSATSDTVTITRAGLYAVHFYASFAANATGTNTVIMRANGVTDFGTGTSPGDGTVRALTASTYYDAAVGDTIVFIVRQTSGGALNTTGRLLMQRIRQPS